MLFLQTNYPPDLINQYILRLIHTGDSFMREASDFLVTSMDTSIFYSDIQIDDFPSDFMKLEKNCLLSNGCCTHSSEQNFQFNSDF